MERVRGRVYTFSRFRDCRRMESPMNASCVDATAETVELILGEETRLRGLARRLARRRSDADDLVQETLLRAYRARGRFQPGTSVRAWTTTIMRRVFITDSIRDQRRGVRTETDARRRLDSAAAPRSRTGVDPALDVRALGDELDDAVKRALDRVPEVYRTSFFLAVVRDLSSEEIAKRLRIPPGTVQSRIHRARERLRAELGARRAELFGSDARRR